MVKQRMDLLELVRNRAEDADLDFLREAMGVLVQAIMEAEVAVQIGAEHGERSPGRLTQRNGYRPRPWDTRVGTLELQIPRVREGSYFPTLLEPRRRSERALLAVVQQAYVEGVSTRKVDALVKSLGCEGISKSQVSRICQELDQAVESFLGRPLDGGPYPYLWLDALTQKVREEGRIVNVSVVVATAVNTEGKREVLGMDVGASEDGAFWLGFLRSLVARGLSGVQLVTSDAHQGLKDAIATAFGEACWQRCRTHFMTNLPVQSAEASATLGGDDDTHHLPTAIAGRGPRPAPARGRAARGALPRGGRPLGGGWAGHLGLHRLPRGPLEAGVVEQPAGAGEQGDQAPHGRGGHLPESGRRPAPRRRDVGRAARRVAGRPGAISPRLSWTWAPQTASRTRCCCPQGRLD